MTDYEPIPLRFKIFKALEIYAIYQVAGAAMGALALIVSLFNTGARAQYLRTFSVGPLIVLGVVGLLYAAIFLLRLWRAERKASKISN